MNRTYQRAHGVLKAVSKVGRHLPSYLVTHTMSEAYDNHERRASWRKFLDSLRKLNPVCVFWITERHEGGGRVDGRIHHHAVVVMPSVWWYSKQVKRWSWAYSKSTNGLQIERVKRSASAYLGEYLSKGFRSTSGLNGERILTQTAGDDGTLPFRWWGYSGVVTSGTAWLEHDALLWGTFRTRWCDRTRVWTSTAVASDWASVEMLERHRIRCARLAPVANQRPPTR